MSERAIEILDNGISDKMAESANRQSTLKDVKELFSDQLTEEEKKTLAKLEISSDANAERLAGRLTALCRRR
jgi:hypothetical protein